MNFGAVFLGLGFVSPVISIVSAGFFYVLHCRVCPDPERRISGTAYVIVLLVCAMVAYFLGLRYGIAWACSAPPPWGGNLCGLAGFFVTGPVAAMFAVSVSGGALAFIRSDRTEPRR
jgi:hypothetical protein